MSIPATHYTPNVRVENPKVRKVVGDVLGWGTVALTTATAIDQVLPAVDYSGYTGPAAAVLGVLLGVWQVLITSPNVPAQPTSAELVDREQGV